MLIEMQNKASVVGKVTARGCDTFSSHKYMYNIEKEQCLTLERFLGIPCPIDRSPSLALKRFRLLR